MSDTKYSQQGMTFRESVEHMVDHAIEIMGLDDGLGNNTSVINGMEPSPPYTGVARPLATERHGRSRKLRKSLHKRVHYDLTRT